ncbi:uncharacterized protein LOC117182782 [Belonocnema kinseyi]|uniref:uncharacterized protein LOC117182782 n=1 Tax=Belonocnema kinseyi TaxID=2817044 RepID=UPI00143DCF27|nr:uncharacterized protein LOC117182782 [Belonocnema kinseyi]
MWDQVTLSSQKGDEKYQTNVYNAYMKEYGTWCEAYDKKKKLLRVPESKLENTCEKCARIFKNKSDLNWHKRVICGVTPQIRCNLCDKRFKRNPNLQRHIFQVHQQTNFEPLQKKYDCDKCSGSYKWAITVRDVAFQEALLAAVKHQYEIVHKTNTNSGKTIQVPAYYLQPAPNMREISPNCGFYLPEDTIAYINVTAENAAQNSDTEKWRIITREVLLEVYGNTLANYSATGKRGGRQSINPMLFKGLFEWANRAAAGMLPKKKFITHINKTAANKRKYQKTSTNGASSPSRENGQKKSKTGTTVTKSTHAESLRTASNSKDQYATEELHFPEKEISRDFENLPVFKTEPETGLASDVWNSDGHVPSYDHYMDSTRRFHSSDSTRDPYTDPTMAPYYEPDTMPAFPGTQDLDKEWIPLKK